MKLLLTAALAAAAALTALPASAATLSDKRSGGDYAFWDYSNIFTKSNLCGCDPSFSVAVVDSFTLAKDSTISAVAADLVAFDWAYDDLQPTFTGFGDAQGYRVSIFSSAAKAGESLIGDVYSALFAADEVAFDVGAFGADEVWDGTDVAGTAAATFDLDLTLAAGTYWLGVMAVNDPDDNGTISVGISGSGDAMWANPGGGFELGDGNLLSEGGNAGYALFGAVPEPASWAMMIIGFGMTGATLRRRMFVLAA
jgi:hypothetical protein